MVPHRSKHRGSALSFLRSELRACRGSSREFNGIAISIAGSRCKLWGDGAGGYAYSCETGSPCALGGAAPADAALDSPAPLSFRISIHWVSGDRRDGLVNLVGRNALGRVIRYGVVVLP